MIDLTIEIPLSLATAARTLPTIDGRRVHVSTLWRWCRRGLHGICLEYARVGGRIVVTTRTINEFVNRLSAADSTSPVTLVSAPPTARKRSAKQRQRDIERAECELSAAGI